MTPASLLADATMLIYNARMTTNAMPDPSRAALMFACGIDRCFAQLGLADTLSKLRASASHPF